VKWYSRFKNDQTSNEVCRRSGRPWSIWTDENVERVGYASMTTDGIIGNSKTIRQYTTLYYSNLKTYMFRLYKTTMRSPVQASWENRQYRAYQTPSQGHFRSGNFQSVVFHVGK